MCHFNIHLKPKNFVKSYKLYGTYENLTFKMISEMGTRSGKSLSDQDDTGPS